MDEVKHSDERIRDRYLDSSSRIGYALCRDSIWASGACNWMGTTVEPIDGTPRPIYRALSPDLYGGTAGIGLFLAHLASVTDEIVVARTARGAIKQAISSHHLIPESMAAGFYAGLPGICYAAIVSGKLLKCPEFTDWGFRELKKCLLSAAPKTTSLDVVGGVAGVIPLLLAMSPSWELSLELAIALGDRLLRHAKSCERGMSWPMNLEAEKAARNLTGFSHGASGFAWALSELFNETKAERFGEAARLGIKFENSWFDQSKGNWPDFRSNIDAQFAVAWCHGAPGIGLARARLFQIHQAKEYLNDLRAAILCIIQSFTSSHGRGTYCLCHGHGGNAETLLVANQGLENSECTVLANEIALTAIQQYQTPGLPFESGTVGRNPSLMVGDAGIGYWMMRMFSQDIPSILLFDVARNKDILSSS